MELYYKKIEQKSKFSITKLNNDSTIAKLFYSLNLMNLFKIYEYMSAEEVEHLDTQMLTKSFLSFYMLNITQISFKYKKIGADNYKKNLIEQNLFINSELVLLLTKETKIIKKFFNKILLNGLTLQNIFIKNLNKQYTKIKNKKMIITFFYYITLGSITAINEYFDFFIENINLSLCRIKFLLELEIPKWYVIHVGKNNVNLKKKLCATTSY